MDNRNKIVLLILLIFFMLSCKENNTKKVDEFYTATTKWDLYRIPLIKPLEIISVIGYGDDWSIELPYKQIKYKNSIPVSAINVVDSIIIGYGNTTKSPNKFIPAFVIDVKNKTEKLFNNKESFEKELSRLKLDTVKLFDVNEAYELFKKKGELPFDQYEALIKSNHNKKN